MPVAVVCIFQGILKIRKIKYDRAVIILHRNHLIREVAFLALKWHKSHEVHASVKGISSIWTRDKGFHSRFMRKKRKQNKTKTMHP